MEHFGGVLEEDLGDFKFEADAKSLQQILDNRAISPTSLGYGKPKPSYKCKESPKLAPETNQLFSMKKQSENFEVIDGKNDDLLCRPRAKETMKGESTKKNRGLGRDKLKGVLPVRLGKLKSPEKVTNGNKKALKVTKNKLNTKTTNFCKSEKKTVPFNLPPPRQSISERKAIPKIDKLKSLNPNSLRLLENDISNHNKIRKELDFNEGYKKPLFQEKAKEGLDLNSNGQKHAEAFNFAKPFDIQEIDNRLSNMFSKQKDSKSLAKMIMMRESLAGMPKESIGELFRQSLSLAELDRLFEDESTESFENLETRLKRSKRYMRQNDSPTRPATGNSKEKNENDGENQILTKQDKIQEQQLVSESSINNSGAKHHESIHNTGASNAQDDEFGLGHEGNKPHKSSCNDTFVEIYEIEYSDDEDFDRNETINISSLLQRSLNINDLQDDLPIAQKEESDSLKDSLIPLKIMSDTNLIDSKNSEVSSENALDTAVDLADNLKEENEFLRQAQKDLDKCNQEQVRKLLILHLFITKKFIGI